MLSNRCIRNCCFPLCRQFSAAATNNYDLAVIGGGPGGYVAAIRAAQLGLKTVCIEKRGTLGGTCLNVGCIPSKALLNISHKYHEAKHDFKKLGLEFSGDITVNVPAMLKVKDTTVKGLTGGIEMLFKANNVTYVKGAASFKTSNSLTVNGLDGKEHEIGATNVIVATGSESSLIPGNNDIIPDEKDILTSTGALELSSPPKDMLVIGGGVIGLEMGSVWSRLGTNVTVVEFLDRITPTLDSEVSSAFLNILKKQGMKFQLGSKVTGVVKQKDGRLEVTIQDAKTAKESKLVVDKVLLSVGRKPFTSGLGLDKISAELDKAGRIVVDNDLRLKNQKNVFAIGDVIAGPMLAHKAEEEGYTVAERIAAAGKNSSDDESHHVNYRAIPSVVYTHPEVAGVGSTEEELKESKVVYKKSVFPFMANSRARANNDTDGFVKVMADKETDEILGAWIIGPSAGDLIQELVLGIEYGASSEDIGRTCHAHPTLSEAVKEACMGIFAKPVHNVAK